MTRVVLASASPSRRKVLRQAGIDALVVVSGVDEDEVVAALDAGSEPAEVTIALATAKAQSVARAVEPLLASDCLIIGCDSMLFYGGELRGKPDSPAAARRHWQLMAGHSGELHTGHCVIRLRDHATVFQTAENVVSTVHFGSPTTADLDAYIASGEPMTVAGGFTLNGVGGWFIDGIAGDPTAVVGISLPLIRKMVESAGLSLSRLWDANPLRPGP